MPPPAGAPALEVLTTDWDDEGGWVWQDVFFLDRHSVICSGSPGAVTQFQLETQPTPGVFNSRQIRYSYTCDSNVRLTGDAMEVSSKTVTGRTGITPTYLDMAGVKLACEQDYVLMGFALKASGTPAGREATYRGACVKIAAPLSCSERATPWAPGGRGELRNLEKHDIRCELGGHPPSRAQAGHREIRLTLLSARRAASRAASKPVCRHQGSEQG